MNIQEYPQCDLKKLRTNEQLHFRYLHLITMVAGYIEARKNGEDTSRYVASISEFGLVASVLDVLIENHTYTYEEIKDRVSKRYRKQGTTRIRVLTEADFQVRGGVIHSLESKNYPFTVPGDYLAKGGQDEEWVMKKEYVERTYRIVPGTCDKEGFDRYVKLEAVHAIHFEKQFRLVDQNGRLFVSEAHGGWMVWTDAGELWICADRLFCYDEI